MCLTGPRVALLLKGAMFFSQSQCSVFYFTKLLILVSCLCLHLLRFHISLFNWSLIHAYLLKAQSKSCITLKHFFCAAKGKLCLLNNHLSAHWWGFFYYMKIINLWVSKKMLVFLINLNLKYIFRICNCCFRCPRVPKIVLPMHVVHKS